MTSDELAESIYSDFERMVAIGYKLTPAVLVEGWGHRTAYAMYFDECDISNPEVFLFAIANDLCENSMETQS